MPNQLVVIEREDAIIVAWADAPQDWVASFRKAEGFPAREWAERMVSLFNHGTYSPNNNSETTGP